MYGVVLAFKKYSAMKGILGSPWVDPWYKWFMKYYQSPYFARTITNTFILSFSSLLFGFPLPILLALLLNEVRNRFFQKFVQKPVLPDYSFPAAGVNRLDRFSSAPDQDLGSVPAQQLPPVPVKQRQVLNAERLHTLHFRLNSVLCLCDHRFVNSRVI